MKMATLLKKLMTGLLVAGAVLLTAQSARATQTVTSIPVPALSSTPPAQSWSMILSPGGDFCVFHSLGQGLTQDQAEDGVAHLFRRDLPSGPNRLLTRSSVDQKLANGASIALALSGNGRYLLVLSDATNLTTNTVKGDNNLFRLDLETGLWQLVNHDIARSSASGNVNTAQISSDGRLILFNSPTKSLGNFPPTVSGKNLLLADMETGDITIENSFPGGFDNVTDFALSPDGKNAIYIPGPTTISVIEPLLLVVRDLKARISQRTTQGRVDRTRASPITISPDGQFYFLSRTASRQDLPFFTLIRGKFGTTNVATTTAAYPITPLSDTPLLPSADGSRLFFSHTNGVVYWAADISTNLIPASMVATNGSPAPSVPYAISDDGNRLLYGSSVDPTGAIAPNLDLYLADLTTKQITLITHPFPQDIRGESVASAAMDKSAQHIFFESAQSDYTPDDLNESHDLFEFDLATASISLLTPKVAGSAKPRLTGYTRTPAQCVSDDGSYSIFFTIAPFLLGPFQTTNLALIGQNLITGQREILSVDTNGVPAVPAPVIDAVLSRNGNFVLMLTTATNMTSHSVTGGRR